MYFSEDLSMHGYLVVQDKFAPYHVDIHLDILSTAFHRMFLDKATILQLSMSKNNNNKSNNNKMKKKN